MNTMARKKILGIGLFVALMALAAIAWLAINPMGAQAGEFNNGNDSPTGQHFSLKLHGVENPGTGFTAPDEKGNGGNIWIPLDGKCDIGLREGAYAVTDRSCFDGDRAEFWLPKPVDGPADGTLNYSVWVRVTATKAPDSTIDMTTCFTEPGDPINNGGTFCNTGAFEIKAKGKSSKFEDVSKELLTVCVDEDSTEGVSLKSHGLFEDDFEDYFWHVNNKGVRTLQMRFYPIGTDPVGETCTRNDNHGTGGHSHP